MYDIQVKRIHEYKRQHLNVFHILRSISVLKHNPNLDVRPARFFSAAKRLPVTTWPN